MNKVRNLINGMGHYQGTPVVDILLVEEPTFEWLEGLPSYIAHSHILVRGSSMMWDLDPLITTIYQNTALSYIQLVIKGRNPFIGSLRPDWLTVEYSEAVIAVHLKEINELILHVDGNLVWQQVEEIAMRIRNFELVVSFIPVEPIYSNHAMSMALKFDQTLSRYGQALYVEPLRGGAPNAS